MISYWREIAIGALILALAGQQVRILSEKQAHTQTKTQHARVLQDLAEKTTKAYKAVLADQNARAAHLRALDEKHTKELQNAQAENDRLAECVRTGKCGLRIRAVCPATRDGVPQAAGAPRVDDAEGPRLDDAATRDYFRLRAGIETAQRQIAGLQDYITSVCLAP